MSNSQKGIFIGSFILLMVLLVWFFTGGDTSAHNGKHQAFVSSNWRKRYQPFDKNPMGTYLFHRMVQAQQDSSADLYVASDWIELDSIRTNDPTQKTYLFVGNIFGVHSNEIDSILADVDSGACLFLSYDVLMSNVINRIFDDYNERQDYTESIRVFTDKKHYDMYNIYQNDTLAGDWKAFGDIVTKEPYKGLSSFMEMDNFIRIKRGKGTVFMHATPELFYNYQIKRKDGFRYASFVIDQLPEKNDVILLELGRSSDDFGNQDVDESEGTEGKKEDSYLQILFGDPALRTAMLLGILGIILFVIFRSKRMRPVVPYLEKKKDMTLAFAETITSIYFSKRNPYGLLQIQKKNFYTAIQKHFFIDLQRRSGDREINTLAEKSNKSTKEIKEILALLETTEAFSVNEQYISQLAAKKRKFYLETGIVSEKTSERISEREMIFRRSLLLPMLFILSGVGSIVVGFAFLINGIGVGIVFWPLGILLLYLGIVRISAPMLRIGEDEIIFTNSFGRKKTFKREELIACDMYVKGVVMRFTENRKLIINLWDLSVFDRKQFERFVSKLHMDSYDK